jgi:hypothetical protein
MRLFKKLVVLILALFASLSLVACDKSETKLEEALNSIALGDLSSVTQDIELIAVTGKHKLPIEWSIENVKGETAELDLTGEVPIVRITRAPYTEEGPGEWGEVRLTATVRIGKKSLSRHWDIFVKPGEKVFILSVGDAAKQPEGTPVRITGTVTYLHGSGFFMQDDSGAIYVYGKPSNDKVVPGAKVEVEGSITIYYGQPEIDRGYKLTVLEEAPEGGFDYSEAADAFIPEIVWSSVNDPKSYGRILAVTGKVTEGQYGDYKNLELTDETTNTKIMIYHDSEEGFIDAITANKDKYVTATVITYNFHSSDKVWRVFGYAGSVEEAEAVQYTDENKVYLTSIKLKSEFDGISVVSDLTLPTSLSIFEGVTISWKSNNTGVIADDGKFTYPTTETVVELTATITLGDVSNEYTYKVTALAPEQMTVAELLAAIDEEKAKAVLVEGVIIGRDSNGYFYLADETGVIYSRQKLSDHGLKVGDKIRMIGDGSIYSGSASSPRFNRQLGNQFAVIEKVAENQDSPLEIVKAKISDFDHTITNNNVLEKAAQEELFGKIFEISGFFKLVQSGSYTDLYLAESLEEDADMVRIYQNSMEVDALKMLAGKEVTLIAVVYECYPKTGLWNLGFLGREGDLKVTLTNEDLEEIAEKEINAILPEDNVLVGDLNFFDKTKYSYVIGNVTYEFTSSNTDILGDDGKFTAPAEDTELTLTVKAIFSEEHEKTFTFELTAKAPEEPDEEGLLISLDFGTEQVTGYAAGTLKFTNGDGKEYQFEKDRVQINTSDYVPHDTAGAILVLSTRKEYKIAWIEFDWSSVNLNKITIDFSVWNQNNFDTIVNSAGARIALEKEVDGEWVAVENVNGLTNVLSELVKDQYITVTFENLTSGKYRLVYEDPNNTASNNTTTAVTADNLKVYGSQE